MRLLLLLALLPTKIAPSPEDARYAVARTRRNLGWGLAAGGIAALAAGTILAVVAFTSNSSDPKTYDEMIVPDLEAGLGLWIGGLALIIPGIILSIQGQSAMTDVNWRRGLIPHAGITRGGGLVGVTVRF